MDTLHAVLFVGVLLAQSLLVVGDNVTDFVASIDQTLMHYGNLTSFASIIRNAPRPLLVELMQGNHTLIATLDDALRNYTASSSGLNANDYETFLRYQILAGTLQDISSSQLRVSKPVAYRTLLQGGQYANLPGNQAQVLSFAHYITDRNLSRVRTFHYDIWLEDQVDVPFPGPPPLRLDIRIIGVLLPPPPALVDLTAPRADQPSQNFTTFYEWGQWRLSLRPDALETLDGLQGVTVLGYYDDWLAENNQTLSVPSDAASKRGIFGNLYVSGIALYSNTIDDTATLVTASGQYLSFINNSTGLYVISGAITATIVLPDIIVAGGVVHCIDRPLLNTNVDLAAASSAASSVSSMMATQTSIATTPLGPTSPVASSLFSSSTSSIPKKPPIGAIIGGAVGGVALLAFCALGSCLLVRRRRRKHGKAAWVSGERSGSEKGGWGSPRLPANANVAEVYEVPYDAPGPDARNGGVGAAQPHEMVSLLPINDANTDGTGRPQLAAHRVSIDPPGRTDGNDQHDRGSESRGGGGEGANRPMGDGGSSPQHEALPRSHSPQRDVMSIANATAEILLRQMMGHQSSGSGSDSGSIQAPGSRAASSADYWASVAAAGGDKTRVSTIENPDPVESERDAGAQPEAPARPMTAPPEYQQ